MEVKRMCSTVLLCVLLLCASVCGCRQKTPAGSTQAIEKLKGFLIERSLPAGGDSSGVRLMYIKDFTAIQTMLKERCKGSRVGLKVESDRVYFTYELADQCSFLILTNDVLPGSGEIARLSVNLCDISGTVCEIRFFRSPANH